MDGSNEAVNLAFLTLQTEIPLAIFFSPLAKPGVGEQPVPLAGGSFHVDTSPSLFEVTLSWRGLELMDSNGFRSQASCTCRNDQPLSTCASPPGSPRYVGFWRHPIWCYHLESRMFLCVVNRWISMILVSIETTAKKVAIWLAIIGFISAASWPYALHSIGMPAVPMPTSFTPYEVNSWRAAGEASLRFEKDR